MLSRKNTLYPIKIALYVIVPATIVFILWNSAIVLSSFSQKITTTNKEQEIIDYNIDFKFYFMKIDEMVRITQNNIYKQKLLTCKTINDHEMAHSFLNNPYRTDNISTAAIMLFELMGTVGETNWPWYNHRSKSYFHKQKFGSCNKSLLTSFLTDFYKSNIINDTIFSKYPNIRYILIQDFQNKINLNDNPFKTKYIKFGYNYIQQHKKDFQFVTIPPPLFEAAQKYKSRHSKRLSKYKYLIVFQGANSNRIRYLLNKTLELYRQQSDQLMEDIYVYMTSFQGAKSAPISLYKLLQQTKFAFSLPGDRPWCYRFTEIMYFNAIPVRINQYKQELVFPYDDIINWGNISLVFDHSFVEHVDIMRSMINIWRNISDDSINKMKSRLRYVYKRCFRSVDAKINCLLESISSTYF
eukprot:503278_1